MAMHGGGAPWYGNGGWNQMAAYAYQGGQPNSAGGWGDWNSAGYFPQSGGGSGYSGSNSFQEYV